MLLPSELLHSPGDAQGSQLMGESYKALGGTEIPSLGCGIGRKGAAEQPDHCLAAGRGWRKWRHFPGWAVTAQSDQGPPRSPCCGIPKVLLPWNLVTQGCVSVPAFHSLTWRLFVLTLEEWVCFPL